MAFVLIDICIALCALGTWAVGRLDQWVSSRRAQNRQSALISGK
jgi:cytochrome oxidase assembly protein ShyY1